MTPKDREQFIDEKIFPTYQELLNRVARLEAVLTKGIADHDKKIKDDADKAALEAKEKADKENAERIQAQRKAKKEKLNPKKDEKTSDKKAE